MGDTMHERLKLIREVYKRKGIWLRTHPEYNKPALREQFWTEIGEVTGIPRDEARRKWKNMKDAFRKELKRVEDSCDADGMPTYESGWPFYNIMRFVKDQLYPRPQPHPTEVLDESLLEEESGLSSLVTRKTTARKSFSNRSALKMQQAIARRTIPPPPPIATLSPATSNFIPIACKEPQIPNTGTVTLLLGPLTAAQTANIKPIIPVTQTTNIIPAATASSSSRNPVVVRVNNNTTNGGIKRKRDSYNNSPSVTMMQTQQQPQLLPFVMNNELQTQQIQQQQHDLSEHHHPGNDPEMEPSSSADYPELREDDDYHFFLSLIPHLKGFGTLQKLRLRNKIQDLILEESAKNVSCACSQTSPSPPSSPATVYIVHDPNDPDDPEPILGHQQ